MGSPIDVKAVLDAALNIEEVSNMPISVSVYLDETAPADVVARVRAAFASEAPHARITIAYLGGVQAVVNPQDDIAVIVAGVDESTGRFAQDLRDAGVPVMVVTTLPVLVGEIARMSGYPIPDGDIVSPLENQSETAASRAFEQLTAKLPFIDSNGSAAPSASQGNYVTIQKDASAAQADVVAATLEAAKDEPYELTAERGAQLLVHMGEWVIEASQAKRLAFATAFSFVRRPLALMSVHETSVQNAGIAFVLIIPGADLPVLTLNQCKMVMQIAAAYGQKLDNSRVKELAAVVAGGFGCRAVARSVAGVVPVLGWAVRAAVGYTGTKAMGLAAIEYFEAGGGAAGVASVVGSARDAAVRAAGAVQAASGDGSVVVKPSEPDTWQEKTQVVAQAVGDSAKKAFEKAAPVAMGAAKVGAQALRDSVLKSLTKIR